MRQAIMKAVHRLRSWNHVSTRAQGRSLTNCELDPEPEESPGRIENDVFASRECSVDTVEDASANDRDGNGEANKAKDGRNNQLLAKADASTPQDHDGEKNNWTLAVSRGTASCSWQDNSLIASEQQSRITDAL
jgi:hypothetical protein